MVDAYAWHMISSELLVCQIDKCQYACLVMSLGTLICCMGFYSLGQSKTEQEMILAQAQQHIAMQVKPFVCPLIMYFNLFHSHA